jgi:hypothetical protein
MHGRRFRLRIREDGAQRVESFDSEQEAATRRERLRLEARSNATVKVAEALETYAVHLGDRGTVPDRSSARFNV